MEDMKSRIQAILNHLLTQGLIPFELTAHTVNAEGSNENEYVINFHDSRIHSCSFLWNSVEDFDEVVRAAVLERVRRMNAAHDKFWKSRHFMLQANHANSKHC